MDYPTIHANSSKVRMRMMDWMRCPEYEWHIVHTDSMPDQSPRFEPVNPRFGMWFGAYAMSFGLNVTGNKPTGPPENEALFLG